MNRTRFVWTEKNGRLAPEKWPADAPDGCVERRGKMHDLGLIVAAEVILPEGEETLSLDELARRYPAPNTAAVIIAPESSALRFWA